MKSKELLHREDFFFSLKWYFTLYCFSWLHLQKVISCLPLLTICQMKKLKRNAPSPESCLAIRYFLTKLSILFGISDCMNSFLNSTVKCVLRTTSKQGPLVNKGKPRQGQVKFYSIFLMSNYLCKMATFWGSHRWSLKPGLTVINFLGFFPIWDIIRTSYLNQTLQIINSLFS